MQSMDEYEKQNSSPIEIASRNFWYKIIGMLHQDWALVDAHDDTTATVYFLNDCSEVFDQVTFPSKAEAVNGLSENGFSLATQSDFFVNRTPQPPFALCGKFHYHYRPMYSSGKYWKDLPEGYGYNPATNPHFVMSGTVIGDIAGSVYEGSFLKRIPKKLLTADCRFTDDTVLTCAVAVGLITALSSTDREALANSTELQEAATRTIALTVKEYARDYLHAGYGKSFSRWVGSDSLEPYNSYGNGVAMRVSFAGWYATSLEEAQLFAKLSAQITHNHPQAIKGASVVAACIYILKSGGNKEDVLQFARKHYNLDFTLDALRPIHSSNITCEGTVPVAIMLFLESYCFKHIIELAISMGGDVDTLAAIAGSIGEAFYTIPDELQHPILKILDAKLLASFQKATTELDSKKLWIRGRKDMEYPFKFKGNIVSATVLW